MDRRIRFRPLLVAMGDVPVNETNSEHAGRRLFALSRLADSLNEMAREMQAAASAAANELVLLEQKLGDATSKVASKSEYIDELIAERDALVKRIDDIDAERDAEKKAYRESHLKSCTFDQDLLFHNAQLVGHVKTLEAKLAAERKVADTMQQHATQWKTMASRALQALGQLRAIAEVHGWPTGPYAQTPVGAAKKILDDFYRDAFPEQAEDE